MKKTSLCFWLLAIFPVLIYGTPPQCSHNTVQHCTQKDITNAWIIVPWNHGGGHYYHNTLTKEDTDDISSPTWSEYSY